MEGAADLIGLFAGSCARDCSPQGRKLPDAPIRIKGREPTNLWITTDAYQGLGCGRESGDLGGCARPLPRSGGRPCDLRDGARYSGRCRRNGRLADRDLAASHPQQSVNATLAMTAGSCGASQRAPFRTTCRPGRAPRRNPRLVSIRITQSLRGPDRLQAHCAHVSEHMQCSARRVPVATRSSRNWKATASGVY